MAEVADIAVVSFEKFILGNEADKHDVSKELYKAFSTVGWVYLKDFGIPQSRVDEIFALVSPSNSCHLFRIAVDISYM